MAKKRKSSKTRSFGSSQRANHNSDQFYASKIYSSIAVHSCNCEPNDFPTEHQNKIITASSEDMHHIPDCCAHLMITSPPYNVTKDYDENLVLEDYLKLLETVFGECYRVLVDGGRACINVANVGRKPYIPISDYISQIMYGIGFNQRGEIIWDKGASAGGSCAWGSWKKASNPCLRDVHEYILIFSKGSLSREKGESTIGRDEFLEYTKSIWQMSTESAKKVGHPAPFPVELPRRLIQLYSYENDVVFDPFIGAGTTAIAALGAKRRFFGYEIDAGYVQLAEKRIEATCNISVG